MAHRLFDNNKILRVTPGLSTKYITHDLELSEKKSLNSKHSSTSSLLEVQLKLSLNCIKLCKTCRRYLREKLGEDRAIYIKLKWRFSDVQECISSPERLGHHRVKLEFRTKYYFDADDDFLDVSQKAPIYFELYAFAGSQEITIGKRELLLEDFREVNKKKSDVRVHFPNETIDDVASSVAILLLTYQFSTSESVLKQDRRPRTQLRRSQTVEAQMPAIISTTKKMKRLSFENIKVPNREVENFRDSLQLVLNRNKALKTTQVEISQELRERVKWLQSEANWKMTLQEHAILHGKDPTEIRWRQWRDDETANVKLRDYSKKPKSFKPTFTISVVGLKFFQKSSIIKNESVKQIYVEYTFLGHDGPEMETEKTYLKPNGDALLKIGFKKTYPIDPKVNTTHCVMLSNMIKKYEKITFRIISEPMENTTKAKILSCREVAFAEVLVSDLMEQEENSAVFQFSIVNSKDPLDVVGNMDVEFRGMMAVRKMAILQMVPKNYKLLIYRQPRLHTPVPSKSNQDIQEDV